MYSHRHLYYKNRSEERKRKGICVVHKNERAIIGKTVCTKCVVNYKLRNKKRWADAKKVGVCGLCFKNPSRPNRTTCLTCTNINSSLLAKYQAKIKNNILTSLGSRCRCCGVEDVARLTIAHLNNDGTIDRKKYGGNRGLERHLYKLIKCEKSIPPTYSVECYNCNCGAGHNKNICPHNTPVTFDSLTPQNKPHKQAILRYGGVCKGCGETELGFLTIEHVNGGGRKEVREQFGGHPAKFYISLRDNPIREDITILCWNCNCSRPRY